MGASSKSSIKSLFESNKIHPFNKVERPKAKIIEKKLQYPTTPAFVLNYTKSK
jgi:hypothetical protein